MEHRELREAVVRANLDVVKAGLVLLTWGNVSAVDREAGIMAIKPSGVDYDDLTAESIPLVRIADGERVDGAFKPSSDTATHLEIYRNFPSVSAVVHTHSHYAVCFAQAQEAIPCLGTTHADHFFTDIPVTRMLSDAEIAQEYEKNTGSVIVECFSAGGWNPEDTPGVLVAQHGPFAWGPDLKHAVENAIVLEEVARMGVHTREIARMRGGVDTRQSAYRPLVEKHFTRKHGAGAYYGQG